MKVKNIFSIFCFLFSSLVLSQDNTTRLSDVPYTFKPEKLQAIHNSFQFIRSYVDYFYLLSKENKTQFFAISPLWNTNAWCVGDAHAENFGILIQEDASPIFTHNDFDDSAPCPAILDLFRFMTSSKLYDQNISHESILESYKEGLQGKTREMPSSIKKMMKKSLKKGLSPNSSEVIENRIVRQSQMSEIDSITGTQIKNIIKEPIWDMVKTSKITGGSGGLERYLILISSDKGPILLELKEQTSPAIYPVTPNEIPTTDIRIKQTISYVQGAMASHYYKVVKINDKWMLLRPRFGGNITIELATRSRNKNDDIIYYEAYKLGMIHALSLATPQTWSDTLEDIDMYLLGNDLQMMTNKFNDKFDELKNPR